MATERERERERGLNGDGGPRFKLALSFLSFFIKLPLLYTRNHGIATDHMSTSYLLLPSNGLH